VRILKQGVAIRHVTGPDPISKNNVRDYTSGEYDGNPPEDFDEVKASHDITVLDLLTHTSGLMSTWSGAPVNPKGSPQQEDLTNTILADLVPKFAAVPLDFQPGTKWAYSNWAGFDVLARIIEVASGQTYGEFLKQRLLEPLGMKDTWIGPLNDARADRLATRYQMTTGKAVHSHQDLLFRRRWSLRYRRRLLAILPDAAQWRRVQWKAHIEPGFGRLDEIKPRGRSVCQRQ